MSRITNHELHVMFTKLEGKLDTLISKYETVEKWQEKHEERDTERFQGLYDRLEGLNRFAISIATISAAIGVAAKYLLDKIIGSV